jgi:hypothetical protein
MFSHIVREGKESPDQMASGKRLAEFVLFGDSLTEWSFSVETQGFGLLLEQKYAGKVRIVNEGQSKSAHKLQLPATRGWDRAVALRP